VQRKGYDFAASQRSAQGYNKCTVISEGSLGIRGRPFQIHIYSVKILCCNDAIDVASKIAPSSGCK